MTLCNGTVKKAVLYSVLGLSERRIYLTYMIEKKERLKKNNVIVTVIVTMLVLT